MTRKLGRKIVSLVLCMAMAIAMVNLPGLSAAVFADGSAPIKSLRIDGKWYSSDATDISNGATDFSNVLGKTQTAINGGSWSCTYNPTSKTLTLDLDNYSGDSITVMAGKGEAEFVDIYYVGTNNIGTNSSLYAISCDLPLNLRSKSTGKRNTVNLKATGYGIYMLDDWAEVANTFDIYLCVLGYGTVNIDVSGTGVSSPYGIYVATKQNGSINRARKTDKIILSDINMKINVLGNGKGVFANNLIASTDGYIMIHTNNGTPLDLMSTPSTVMQPQLSTEHNYCLAVSDYIAIENKDYSVSLLEDRDCFKVQPSFTAIDYEKGNINLTLNEKVKVTNQRLVKEGETATDAFSLNHQGVFFDNIWYDGDTMYSVPEGVYRVAIEVNGNWYYSNIFTVRYAENPNRVGKFILQPKDTVVLVGNEAEVCFKFTGDIDSTYKSTLQYKDGDSWKDWSYINPEAEIECITGIASEIYETSRVYRIAIYSKGTWVYSDEFTVDWRNLVFTEQPKDVEVLVGNDACFSFVVNGIIDDTYHATLMYYNGSSWVDWNYINPVAGVENINSIAAENDEISKIYRVSICSAGKWFYSDAFTVSWVKDLSTPVLTGKAGDNATWTLNKETGEMVISGSGSLYDSNHPEMFTNKVENYQNIIKTVTYEDGITTSGNSLFGFCQNITSVKLPNSMTTIEAGAFAGTQFANITIPKSVTKIDEYAFMGSSPLTVDYRGSKEDWNKINISQKENKRLLNATVNYHNYTPVSSVSVTGYVAPSEGATPVKPNVPDGVNYKVVRSWYEVPAVGNTKDAKLVTGNFEAGKIYCLTLDFTVSGEYEFTPDVKAYVDGKEVEIVKISDNKIRVLIYTELKPKNGIEGFCERLYTCALGRASDPAGVKAWADALRGGADGAKVARGFFFSDEFINKKLDNKEYVTRLYKTFMDREPDAAGLNAWVEALEKGASREKVFNGFINSVEWANICFKYGIKSGGTAAPTIRLEPSAEILAFAERLYTTCLGRAADPSGLKAWADALANREGSGAKVAHGFFFSEEFINKKFDNGEFVRRCYLTFMDREPDAGGYAAWVKALNDGATREQVFNGFTQSPEFVALCEKSGIIAFG